MYHENTDTIRPEDFLTDWDRRVLDVLGVDHTWELPEDSNPVTDALALGDSFHDVGDDETMWPETMLARLEREDWFDTKTSYFKLSRLATLCQMAVYNAQGGPEGDGKPKALRRHWYAWYKVRFAQPFAAQIEVVTGEKPSEDTWAARLSGTYGKLVDEGATYRGLWVDDASRMRQDFYDTLFNGSDPAHILLCVEKDSLFDDFVSVARAVGARAITSGKGKNSRASAEKILREFFGWRSDHDPFTEDNPLVVIVISDWDYDGHAVIDPTFSEQMRRYTPHVREARVGIMPEHIARDEWESRWYEVKASNRGYVDWCEQNALFVAECLACGHRWPVQGVRGDKPDYGEVDWNSVEPVTPDEVPHKHECPDCFSLMEPLRVKISGEIVDTPHGFEVEAMPTRDYYDLVVDALLHVFDFEDVVARLRKTCKADPWRAAETVQKRILDENETYQHILTYLKEYDRVVELKEAFENRVRDKFYALGEPHAGDWEDEGDDPDVEAFREHARQARDYSSPWQPFDAWARTDLLVEYLEETHASKIEWFKQHRINW